MAPFSEPNGYVVWTSTPNPEPYLKSVPWVIEEDLANDRVIVKFNNCVKEFTRAQFKAIKTTNDKLIKELHELNKLLKENLK